MDPFEETEDGLKLQVRLAPKSKRDSIDGQYDGRLKISITSPPVDGKANAHLIKFLSKKLKIAKGRIRISAGETSRNKTLILEGIDKKTATEKLGI